MKRKSFGSKKKITHHNWFWYLITFCCVVLIVVASNKYVSYANGKISTVSVLSTTKTADASTVKTVCLDPGHGGDGDPGATHGDITEREMNLTVAQKVGSLLTSAGFKVVYTRTTADAVLDNSTRADYCNAQKADILVSIHHNDFTDSTTDYSTALFYKSSDQELAQYLLDSVSTDLNVTNDGLSNLEDNVMAKANMPAALVEGFFVSSDYEYNLVTADGSTRLDDEAAGIAEGIEKYFAK